MYEYVYFSTYINLFNFIQLYFVAFSVGVLRHAC